jgi:hypothetical protein
VVTDHRVKAFLVPMYSFTVTPESFRCWR